MNEQNLAIATYGKYINAIQDFDDLKSFINDTKRVSTAQQVVMIGQKYVSIIPENIIH